MRGVHREPKNTFAHALKVKNFEPSGARAENILEYTDQRHFADAPVPCVTRSSADIISTMEINYAYTYIVSFCLTTS